MESSFVVTDAVEEARAQRDRLRSVLLKELKRTPGLPADVLKLLDIESTATQQFHELWTKAQVQQ